MANPGTNGAEESVIISEVFSFQRLKCMQEWYLGWEKVSCLERCPQFRNVLIEREREVPIQLTVARPIDVPHQHCTSKPASSRPT